MVNVRDFVHHWLLNVLYENRLMLFEKQMKKIFRQIFQLIPMQKKRTFVLLFLQQNINFLPIDNFQDMLQQ
jgi:hypothetical protein